MKLLGLKHVAICCLQALTINAQYASCASKASSSKLSTWERIHHTLNLYPPAVDFKNSALFACVFAPEARANYTGPLSNLTGLDAIRDGLLASVSSLVTQHQLGTTLIEIANDGKAANSTTYFLATLFSTSSETRGAYTVLHGLYSDQLVETEEGWRITERDLVFMTPNIGNLTLG